MYFLFVHADNNVDVLHACLFKNPDIGSGRGKNRTKDEKAKPQYRMTITGPAI